MEGEVCYHLRYRDGDVSPFPVPRRLVLFGPDTPGWRTAKVVQVARAAIKIRWMDTEDTRYRKQCDDEWIRDPEGSGKERIRTASAECVSQIRGDSGNKKLAFRAALREAGWGVWEEKGDGNCLFRSIAHQELGNANLHDRVRQRVRAAPAIVHGGLVGCSDDVVFVVFDCATTVGCGLPHADVRFRCATT